MQENYFPFPCNINHSHLSFIFHLDNSSKLPLQITKYKKRSLLRFLSIENSAYPPESIQRKLFISSFLVFIQALLQKSNKSILIQIMSPCRSQNVFL